MGRPQTCAAAYATDVGATALRRPANVHLMAGFLLAWTNVNGLESSPIMKAREKLTVASVANDMPRNRRENDLMSWKCCVVGL